MLKFLIPLIFVSPICFFSSYYWFIQLILFIFRFSLIINFYSFDYFIIISYSIGLDLLSYVIIILSAWICSLMLLTRSFYIKLNNFFSLFSFLVIIILILLFFTFFRINFLYFYFFFERSLIPTLFLIVGWGYQPERLQAGIYLLFYTLFASLPLLIAFIFSIKIANTLFINIIQLSCNYSILYVGLIVAFLVKMPIYLFHLWLPKAHVEAPISGSIILAGILLKLGGYGLLRVIPLILKLINKFRFILIIIRLVGSIYVRILCLSQLDIKSLIAYSSVAHMALVLRGIITLRKWGLTSSLVLMVGHGLCSSGLFCLANINYDRLRSRRIIINKGIISFIPRFSMWWFLFSASNIACPPTLNLLGELGLLNSLINWSPISIFTLRILSFFSAAYSLYLYSYTQHGKFLSLIFSFYGGTQREFLILFLHLFPLNYLIIKRDLIIIWY